MLTDRSNTPKTYSTFVRVLCLAILSAPSWMCSEALAENYSAADAIEIKHEGWANEADLAITLDQHMYPALLDEIKEYGTRHKIKIAVRAGTCGVSAGALSNKTVDMAGFCCPPSEVDLTLAVDYHTIAIGAIAMYVNPENPINNLSMAEARGVFAGDITNWSSLKTSAGTPGPSFSILPVGRLHCKTRPGHWRLLLDNEDEFSLRLHEVGAIEDVFRQVEANPYSIGGFESLYMAQEIYPTKTQLKPIKIDGYAPTPDNLLAGNYPLYFVFNITTWKNIGTKKALIDDFIGYLRDKVNDIDAKFGMVSFEKLRQAGWKISNDSVISPPEP